VIGSLYLLMHPDLRSTPRFRSLFDFFVAQSRRYRATISGELAGVSG
jgi:hypothetical protein